VKTSSSQIRSSLKRKYLRKAISEYEYSPAPEYDKRTMTRRAARGGTVDLDHSSAATAVEIGIDGAWVNARVWIPKDWITTDELKKKTNAEKRRLPELRDLFPNS
jgi:hypothetical protein